MKILLIAGHGAGDSGATGCGYKEADLTRELVNIIAGKLRSIVSVDVYNQARNAYQDVLNGNFSIGKYGYVLEIHFNAFNISAHGTECFVLPEEGGITVEQAVMRNMGKLFTLRDNDNIFDGVKKKRFTVINACKKRGMSGALLETCFIDNPSNMQTYQQNKDTIAEGIVAGIVEGFGINGGNTKPTQKPGNTAYQETRINYRAHCQTSGILPVVRDGQTAGLVGYAKRLEGLYIDLRKLREQYPSAKLKAKAHIQGIGWKLYENVEHDTLIGTQGQGRRLEAIELELTGVAGKTLLYRTHLAKDGWTGWVKGGFASGSVGIKKRIEAIQIKVE